ITYWRWNLYGMLLNVCRSFPKISRSIFHFLFKVRCQFALPSPCPLPNYLQTTSANIKMGRGEDPPPLFKKNIFLGIISCGVTAAGGGIGMGSFSPRFGLSPPALGLHARLKSYAASAAT